MGYEGEWRLSRPDLSLVVGGKFNDPRRRRPFGAIVDAVVSSPSEDELRSLTTVLWIGDEEMPVRTTSVSAGEQGRLRIVQESPGTNLRIITEIELSEAGVAELTTRLWNAGKTDFENVSMGDRLQWPDGPSYLPGQGIVREPLRRKERWVARRGKEISYALAGIDSPLTFAFGFDPHGEGPVLALGSPRSLRAGQTVFHRRALVVVKGALPAVLERIWHKLDLPLGQVRGQVSPAPVWAQVEAIDEHGPVALADVDAEGRFSLALPLGAYRLVARCPGGEDTANIRVESRTRTVEVSLTAPQVGTLTYRITNRDGVPGPARLTIVGIPPTVTPVLAARPSSKGAGNAHYTATGLGELPLPPGQYEVYVSRGPEYSLFVQRIAVSPQSGAILKATLDREYFLEDWVGADLHVHAAPSFDCEVSIEDRLIAALAEGLDAVVATDHNWITDYAPAAATFLSPPDTIRGIEVTTGDPNIGHFNVWPLSADDPPPPFNGQSAKALLGYLEQNHPSAIIQVNHPRMSKYGIGYFDIFKFNSATASASEPDFDDRFNAVELLNGTELDTPDVRDAVLSDFMRLLSAGRRITATAGSDSHHLYGQWMGWPRTYIRLKKYDRADTRKNLLAPALRQGAAVVSNGIFVDLRVDGHEPGDTVIPTASTVKVAVRALAASWVHVDGIAIWHNGEIVAEGGCGTGRSEERCRMTVRLPVSGSGWVAASAEGGALTEALPGLHGPAYGFANPVYVETATTMDQERTPRR